MRVIINADDFGYSREINASIKKAIEINAISSATIIANSPFFDDAIQIAKNNPNVSFGVHLNLIEFKPLSEDSIFRQYGLVESDGRFRYGAIFSIQKFPKELKGAIKKELELQILKVMNAGIPISHLDSHQHTHAISQLEDIVIGLLKRFSIGRIRKKMYWSIPLILRAKEYVTPKYSDSFKLKTKQTFIVKCARHFFVLPFSYLKWIRKMKNNAKMADFLFSYQFFVQEYRRKKSKYDRKTIEIECHPGLDTNFEETAWLFEDRLREYSPEYELITYNEL